MQNSDISLELSLTSKNGALQVDFSDVKVSLESYEVTFDGESDLSRAVQILFKNLKGLVTNELTNIIGWRLAKSVEVSLNQLLSSGGEIVDLSRTNRDNNYWNITLLQDPIFKPKFVSFVLDGSFHSGNSILNVGESQHYHEFPKMPI